MAGGGRLAAITVIVITVISSIHPELNPFLNAALRFIEACFGAGVALLVVRVWRGFDRTGTATSSPTSRSGPGAPTE